MIRRPVVRENTAFKTINEPGADELNQEIEEITRSSIDRNNCATKINWEHYASRERGLKGEIETLKQTLAQIDQKVATGITEMRLTAYHDIRHVKAQHTPQYRAEAKQLTKKRPREFFALNEKRQDMRKDRLRAREDIVTKKENETVQQAIGRFKTRITEDFEPSRLKDIRNACVAFLKASEEVKAGRGVLLMELVAKISPGALIEYHKTIPTATAAGLEVAAFLGNDLSVSAELSRLLAGRPLIEHHKTIPTAAAAGLEVAAFLGKDLSVSAELSWLLAGRPLRELLITRDDNEHNS